MDQELDAANILISMKYTVLIKKSQECQICYTKQSPLWRKLPEYTCVCNRCGLKFRKDKT